MRRLCQFCSLLYWEIRAAGDHRASILNPRQSQGSMISPHERERLLILQHGAGRIERIRGHVVLCDDGCQRVIGHAHAGEWVHDMRVTYAVDLDALENVTRR